MGQLVSCAMRRVRANEARGDTGSSGTAHLDCHRDAAHDRKQTALDVEVIKQYPGPQTAQRVSSGASGFLTRNQRVLQR